MLNSEREDTPTFLIDNKNRIGYMFIIIDRNPNYVQSPQSYFLFVSELISA